MNNNKSIIQEVQNYAESCDLNFRKGLQETGFVPSFTFYKDLSVAEFTEGEDGVISTVNKIIKEWINNIKAITEFALSVNHKAWEMYDKGNARLTQLYSKLYHVVCAKVEFLYSEDSNAINYFYATLD